MQQYHTHLQSESDECDGDTVDEPNARQAASAAGRKVLEERRGSNGQPGQRGGVREGEPANFERRLSGDVDPSAGPLAGSFRLHLFQEEFFLDLVLWVPVSCCCLCDDDSS